MTKLLEDALKFAKELSFPLEAVTQKFAIMGQSGGGKTYAAMKLAELMLEIGAQIVVIDIPGVWYGLRSSADGKHPGYKVLVVGGEHGDLPINSNAGALIADLVVDRGISVVLDVSQMLDWEQIQFLTEFATRFFERKKRNKSPVHLFLEECQEIIPEQPENKGVVKLRSIFVRMMKIGRNFGIGWSAITQEPQAASKRAINQAGTIIAVRTVGGHERKALEIWARSKAKTKEQLALMDVLPELEQGQALVWSPGWLRHSEVVHVLPKVTFDSSATPKVGEKRPEAKVTADIDLDKLKADMASLVQQAEADDPKLLKKTIADLQRQLAAKPAAPAATGKTETKVVQEKVVLAKDTQALTATVKRLETWQQESLAKMYAAFSAALASDAPFAIAMAKITASLDGARVVDAPSTRVEANRAPQPAQAAPRGGFTPPAKPSKPQAATFDRRPMARAVAAYATPRQEGEAPGLAKGERAVLTAIAQHAEGVSREALTVLTGYKRSTRDAYLQRLGVAGYTNLNGDVILATEEGIAQLGSDFQPLPTGTNLREHWLRELPEGERRVLEVLSECYPQPMERDAIGEATAYKRSTRDAYLQRLKTRKLVLEVRDGMRASDMLFDAQGAA